MKAPKAYIKLFNEIHKVAKIDYEKNIVWIKKQTDLPSFPFLYMNYSPHQIVLLWPTGCKDKNGVEGYLGDIVKIHGRTGTIEWKDGKFIIDTEDYEFNCSGLKNGEIIGNIYTLTGPQDIKSGFKDAGIIT